MHGYKCPINCIRTRRSALISARSLNQYHSLFFSALVYCCLRRGILRSFDNATANIWGKNLTNFPDSAIHWAGYTPTTFTKNLVVTLPENGVLGNRATGLFRGQACARRANAHCEAECDPEVTHPPCVPCDTAAGCSASFIDSFSHDIFAENMYYHLRQINIETVVTKLLK